MTNKNNLQATVAKILPLVAIVGWAMIYIAQQFGVDLDPPKIVADANQERTQSQASNNTINSNGNGNVNLIGNDANVNVNNRKQEIDTGRYIDTQQYQEIDTKRYVNADQYNENNGKSVNNNCDQNCDFKNTNN